ncbi:MAG TPA: TIGR03862 family flavoprotein [Thiobacillaceae bacterium]|nr:TIGR03862 family flavoprotein [Thiobacillaceae bacterium]
MAHRVAVIGGGPAGLMAAETLVDGGVEVDLYDRMPSLGRKFLLAGRGGLNLTHSEPRESFLARYGDRQPEIEPLIAAFGPDDLRAWAKSLGVETFVGSSGRVFPQEMKAAPLLRAWLHRLRQTGVGFHVRHRWLGWVGDALGFETPEGMNSVRADAVVLALGGGSWSRFGSDGAWVPILAGRDIPVAPLKPANCGFDVGWSEHFSGRHAGEPVKSVALAWAGERRQGEFVITGTGVEGSLIYGFSARLRDAIERAGVAEIHLDLMPDWTLPRLAKEIAHPRGARSLSSHLQSRVGLKGVKTALLREVLNAGTFDDPGRLAAAVKSLPLRLVAPRPLEEAISSAGGVAFEALGSGLMVRQLPGVFCAGEMLDWEAPTGGYLLTACFASGRAAGRGALDWLAGRD